MIILIDFVTDKYNFMLVQNHSDTENQTQSKWYGKMQFHGIRGSINILNILSPNLSHDMNAFQEFKS